MVGIVAVQVVHAEAVGVTKPEMEQAYRKLNVVLCTGYSVYGITFNFV